MKFREHFTLIRLFFILILIIMLYFVPNKNVYININVIFCPKNEKINVRV